MGHLNRIARNVRQRYRNKRATKRIVPTGFWFVDIPRTSSTSIRVELGCRFGPVHGKRNVIEKEHATDQLYPEHLSAQDVQAMLGRKNWDAIYTFSIVRNPYERLLSFYNYMKKCKDIPDSWSYSEFVSRHVEAGPLTPYLGYIGLRRTACDFVLGDTGEVIVTDVFRFEERAQAMAQIGERIGFPELGQLHVQTASPPGQDYRQVYDDKTRELVGQFYAQDLKQFGYAF